MQADYKYKNVMLVDDVDLDNFVSKTIITAYHFSENIYVHKGGESALEFLKQIRNASPRLFPEVIFIDINMPVINGFRFIELLRQDLANELERFKPRLVMLTSSVYDSDRQKAIESFKDVIFMVKPLTQDMLQQI